MFDNADQMIGIGAAVAILPLIMAHLKPFLRPILDRLGLYESSDPPWPFLVDALGVAWVYGLMEAGHAPGWINNPLTAILAGIALGIAAGTARDVWDGAQAVAGSRAARNTSGVLKEPQA